jgi:DNA-binding NtrC family response regulator
MSNESPLPTKSAASGQSAPAAVLHDIATMLLHVDRPEMVAFEALDVLCGTGCIEAGQVVARGIDSAEEILMSVGQPAGPETCAQGRVFTIGRAGTRVIELAVRPRRDLESVSSVNALALLIGSTRELERARAEREERATLWPADEQPADGRTVLSGHMREQMSLAQRVANANVNVLITGESGTGKEILARAIHDFSARAKKPFIPFNCAAVPRDLLESQLFGHRRGAFTGADHDQLGLIRAAQGGTLFLDEIGELALGLQPKLLRFLESGEIAPLGEPAPITVNVRVVAATNSNLEGAVRTGLFREDLFYRLNVVRLSLKPLRERRDEIPGLVNHFVARAALESQKGYLTIAEETMERLILYRWPGNVRQLQNELRRMVAMSESNSTLEPDEIASEILGALPLPRPAPVNGREIAIPLHDKLLPTLARVEGEMIKAAFREHHGKVDAIAKALGISRKGLYLKRQRLGL